MIKLDPIILHARLKYDPATGELRWKKRRFDTFPTVKTARMWNNRYPNRVAGTMNDQGYLYIKLEKRMIHAHKVVWTMHYGESPSMCIDHINGVRHDNRIENLRLATRSQNSWNQRPRANNSGYRGVRKHSETKFTAQISASGKTYHLGSFDTAEKAYAAYCEASEKHHGDFGNVY